MCVVCVCVCAGQGVLGNAINLEIMNHLESGVRAHFDQILGRFHGSGPRANHRVSRVKLGIRQRQGKHKDRENTKAGKIQERHAISIESCTRRKGGNTYKLG